MIPHRTESYSTDRDLQCQGRDTINIGTLGKYPFKVEHCLYVCIYALHSFSSRNEECGLVTCRNTWCTVKPRHHVLMAYFHCRSRIRIPTQRRIPVLCRIFALVSDSDSEPLIELYVIGMEICSWDGDPSLTWVQ